MVRISHGLSADIIEYKRLLISELVPSECVPKIVTNVHHVASLLSEHLTGRCLNRDGVVD